MNTDSPSPGPTITGRPGRSARDWGLWGGLAPIAALLLCAGFVLGAALRPVFLQGATAGVTLLVLIAALAALGHRAMKRVGRHDRGAEGEERTARFLEHLPTGWYVYHGVPLSGAAGGGRDIDHIAAGPGGVFLIETVNWTGRITLEDGHLLDNGQAYEGYAIEDFRARAEAMADALEKDGGVRPKVRPVFCAAGGRLAAMPDAPKDLLICEPSELVRQLTAAGDTLSVEALSRCNRALARLVGASMDG